MHTGATCYEPASSPRVNNNTRTVNLRTKILDFGGFDSSRILILGGGIPMSIGDFPEIASRQILAGRIGELASRQILAGRIADLSESTNLSREILVPGTKTNSVHIYIYIYIYIYTPYYYIICLSNPTITFLYTPTIQLYAYLRRKPLPCNPVAKTAPSP